MGGVTQSDPFVQVGFALHIHRLDKNYSSSLFFASLAIIEAANFDSSLFHATINYSPGKPQSVKPFTSISFFV